MKKISKLLAIYFSLFTIVRAYASSSSALMLLKSPSAAAQSMGEAFASIPGDAGGIGAEHYNPASTAYLKQSEVYLMGRNGLADDTFGGVLFGKPTHLGTFSAGFSYYSVGSIDLVDSNGVARTARAEEDKLVNLNYGKTFAQKFSVGGNIKYLNSKLVDTMSASAAAFDLGAQMQWNRFSFGLAVQNMGPSIQYRSASEPLPLALRGGLSQRLDFKNAQYPSRLLWSFDLLKIQDASLRKSVGVEYLWNNMIALRSGNQFDNDNGQLQIGFGFMAAGIQIDYDHLNVGDLNSVHMVSSTYRFGSRLSAGKP